MGGERRRAKAAGDARGCGGRGAPRRGRAPSNLSEPRSWTQALTRHQETHMVKIIEQHFQTWSSFLLDRRSLPRRTGGCCLAAAAAGPGRALGAGRSAVARDPVRWVAPASPGAGKLPGRDGRRRLGGTEVICKLDLELDSHFGPKRRNDRFFPKPQSISGCHFQNEIFAFHSGIYQLSTDLGVCLCFWREGCGRGAQQPKMNHSISIPFQQSVQLSPKQPFNNLLP